MVLLGDNPPGMTVPEVRAVVGYTGPGYVPMNRDTRGWNAIRNNDPQVVRDLDDRDMVEEKGFLSTTTNANVGGFEGPVFFTVIGKSGVDVKAFSLNPSEGERLYPPMTRFKIESFAENPAHLGAWQNHWNGLAPKPKGKPAFTITMREQ